LWVNWLRRGKRIGLVLTKEAAIKRTRRKILLLAIAALFLLAVIDAQRPPENQWATPIALGMVDLWQAFSSGVGLHGACLYTPTCSVYGKLVIHRYGAYQGGWLALKRIWSCSPWSGRTGEDWPPPLNQD